MPTIHQGPRRVALYVRVSTTRQADAELSIPDQIKQGQDYCAARGLKLVETFTEPGASATDDRRPEFQRMIDAATSPERPFDTILVHSMSRFFREQYSERDVHSPAAQGGRHADIHHPGVQRRPNRQPDPAGSWQL